MRIVFMGTPDFSVPCLENLIKNGHEVTLCVTKPDMPVGRKQILTAPPVKNVAKKNNIKVYQPNSLKTDEAFEIISNEEPDAIVVVAYGKILPKKILDIPKLGCINIHASLLPKLRGASPIQWSIVKGEKVTGVTTMLMDEGLDTGDILLTATTEILDSDNAESLHDKLSVLGANLIIDTLAGLSDKSIKPQKQSNDNSSYAPIINKEMGKLDFNKSARELFNLIRGFNPWPCCYFITDRRIKVFSAQVGSKSNLKPGTITIVDDKPFVACKDGELLELIEICPEGSKRMSGKAAVLGRIFSN